MLKKSFFAFFQNKIILCLDFLLTLTTFSDGQSWCIKQTELIEKLVQLAQLCNEKATPANTFNQQISLASLAILRNVGFHPNGRVKFLNDKSILTLLVRFFE
jgi:hypothetical protein